MSLVGAFDGQIDEAELRVGRHRPPDTRVARVLGRAVEPRVVAGLALRGNRVERPEQLARVHVEAAHVALHFSWRSAAHADVARGTDDHDVADDERGRAVADARLFVVISRASRPCRSTTPFSPKPGAWRPVSASSAPEIEARRHRRAARRSPARRSSTRAPRPEVCRGAGLKRSPSFGRQTQSVSPLPASIATTLRVTPTVVYSTPPIISGVASFASRASGRSCRRTSATRPSSLWRCRG